MPRKRAYPLYSRGACPDQVGERLLFNRFHQTAVINTTLWQEIQRETREMVHLRLNQAFPFLWFLPIRFYSIYRPGTTLAAMI